MKRKRLSNTTKSFIIPFIIIVALLLITAIGYAYFASTKSAKIFEKAYVKDAIIYLPKGQRFEPFEDEMNDFSAIGNDMMVTVLIDEKSFFTDKDADIPDLFSYCATIANNNGARLDSISFHEDYYTFEINSEDKNGYHYFAGVYESESDFYLVSFVTFQKDASRFKNNILGYLDRVEISNNEDKKEEKKSMEDMYFVIKEQKVFVDWLDNETVRELYDDCSQKDIVVNLSMYAGNEQFGSLGKQYSRNDVNTTTEIGDVVLYSGDQIVLFYGSNSWQYTRLGKMRISNEEITNLLGNGDIVLRISRK